ncbi:MAG: GntP family permease [Bryobacteraceae bacterium]
MQVAIVLAALALLMFVAYRGVSVVFFAPIVALLAVLCTDAGAALPVHSGIFMERMVGFVKLYFPVILLGAIFGKMMELSGFASSIIRAVLAVVGPAYAIASVVLVCALLTYGGVSLFVVAFAVYPFAAELFRASNIPKRLLPATIALGAFTFTMDAIPGSPQVQNLIPTTFFHTTAWAAPRLGLIGAAVLCGSGLLYLEWRRRVAARNGEGYGGNHLNEPESPDGRARHTSAWLAAVPLVLVGALNLLFTRVLPGHFGQTFDFQAVGISANKLDTQPFRALWPIECALAIAILFVLPWCFSRGVQALRVAINTATAGAALAVLNVASEYGFGAVIATLPGFLIVSRSVTSSTENALVNVAVTSNILAGITGSASGGMSIALGAMSDVYLKQAAAANVPHEVLHRVAAMASGGMDTLPHNGAIITLLSIAGLTHRVAYRDIFALTFLKVATAFLIIGLYTAFHII